MINICTSFSIGDKSAHVATIHIPQLFYFAIFTLFMSWPLIITPSLPSHFFTENFPIIFNASGAGPIIRLQRSLLSLGILCGMLLAVHKNTILHPYLLADNRHYPFYLFRRTVLLHPYIKYLGVPIYYGAGWSVLDVLSRKPRISILLVIGWAGAVIGSIIGAGLVEFRYFIGGWALWRIAVGEESKQGGSSTWRWLLEIVWFAMINVATGWLFLRKGFVWENEPGKIQRFMWWESHKICSFIEFQRATVTIGYRWLDSAYR